MQEERDTKWERDEDIMLIYLVQWYLIEDLFVMVNSSYYGIQYLVIE